MTALLECRGVTRRFGGVVAVKPMDVTLAEGEFLSIIGPNGAGKTTLFNLISGHDAPDGGRIRAGGARHRGECAPSGSRPWASRARSSTAACSPI